MIYSLSTKEDAAIMEIALESDTTPASVMRQAIRLVQLWHKRHMAGETVAWSGDDKRNTVFAGPLS